MRRFLGFAPLALADAIPDGAQDVTCEVDVLELAPQVHGGAPFDFTPHAEAMLNEHARDAAKGYETPVVLSHDATDKDPAVGWVLGLRRVGTRIRATVKLLADFAKRVKAGEYRYISPEIRTGYRDQVGNEVAAKIVRVAVTHTPHQKGHADGGPALAFALTEITDEGIEDSNMADNKVTVEVDTKEAARLLAEFETTKLKPLSDKVDALVTKLTEADAKVVALTERAEKAEKRANETQADIDSRDVRDIVGKALAKGVFVPAQVKLGEVAFAPDAPAWDPLKWLAESPFRDISALRRHVNTALPVVDLTGRQSFATAAAVGSPDRSLSDDQVAAIATALGEPKVTAADIDAAVTRGQRRAGVA